MNSRSERFKFIIDSTDELLRRLCYEVVDVHTTNILRSNSYYYAVYPSIKSEINYKKLIIIRISDHTIHDDSNFIKWCGTYSQNFKFPPDKEKQQWKVLSFQINTHSDSKTYKAFRKISRKLESLKK